MLSPAPPKQLEVSDVIDNILRLEKVKGRGQVANGVLVASSLKRLWDLRCPVPASLKAPELDDLLQTIAESAAHTTGLRTGDPTSGARTKSPLWASLISVYKTDQESPLDAVRWLLVHQSFKNPSAAENDARVLAPLLSQWETGEKKPPLEALKAIRAAICGDADLALAINGWSRGQIPDRAKNIGLRLIQSIDRQLKKRKRPIEGSDSPVNNVSFTTQSGYTAIRAGISSDAADEGFPEMWMANQVDERPLSPNSVRRAAATNSQHLMASRLSLASEGALTCAEATSAYAELERRLAHALEIRDRVEVDAIKLIQLSFITSRGWRDLLETIFSDQAPGDSVRVSIALNCRSWRAELPGSTEVPSHKSERSEPRASKAYAMPLPKTFVETFWIAPRPINEGDHLFVSDPQRVFDVALSIRKALRIALPRFSESRIRLSLPAAMAESTRDQTISQVISGSFLGISEAGLNYFCQPLTRLQKLYRASVRKLLDLDLPVLNDESSGWVGASLPTVDPADLRRAIRHLASAINSAVHAGGDLTGRLRRYQAITAYTAWMFIATVGHRVTYWIEDFQLSAVNPEVFLALITDKLLDAAHITRVTALAPVLIKQFEILRKAGDDLLAWLSIEQNTSRASSKLRDALRKSIDGSGPFFLSISDSLDVKEIDRDWLLSRLPEDWDLPANIFRHRLRTALTEKRISPIWIAMQMGHLVGDQMAFNGECPLAPTTFASKLSKKLDGYLKDSGWQTLPSTWAKKKALPSWLNKWPPEDLRNEWQKTIDEHKKSLRSKRKAHYFRGHKNKETIATWVADRLSSISPGFDLKNPARNVDVTEIHIDQIWTSVSKLSNSSGDLIEACLRSLRGSLLELRSKYGWRGKMPGLPVWLPREASPIGVPHMKAYALIRQLRHDVLSKAKSECEPNHVLGRLLFLLITDANVACFDHLLCALRNLDAAHDIPTDPLGRALCEIETEVHGKQRKHSLALPPSVLAAGKTWTSTKAGTEITEADASRALGSIIPAHLRSKGSRSLLQRFLEIAAMSRRVSLPGISWSSYEARGMRTLSASRTMALVNNEIRREEEKEDVAVLARGPAVLTVPAEGIDSLVEYQKLRSKLHKDITDATAHNQPREAKKSLTRFLKTAQCDISRDLAKWIQRLLLRRNPVKPLVAYEYLTVIGVALLRVLDGRSMRNLDQDELEDVFAAVVAAKKPSEQMKAVGRLLDFHDFLGDQVSPIDASEVFEEVLEDVGEPEAEIITSRDFDAAKALIVSTRTQAAILQRLLSIGELLLVLYYRLGLRFGEGIRARHCDIFQACGETFLYVRSTQHGTIKTPAGRRLLSLSSLLSPQELAGLLAHASNEKRIRGAAFEAHQPLFATNVKGEYDRRVRSDVSKLIQAALRGASGRTRARAHWLRHSFGCRHLSRCYMGHSAHLIERGLGQPLPSRDIFFTQRHVTRLLGHARPRVTLSNYWHLQHLRTAFVNEGPAELSMEDFAGLASDSAERVRQVKFRSKKAGTRWDWVRDVLEWPLTATSVGDSASTSSNLLWLFDSLSPDPLSVFRFAASLEKRDIPTAARVADISPAIVPQLLAVAKTVEQRTGIRVVGRTVGQSEMAEHGIEAPSGWGVRPLRISVRNKGVEELLVVSSCEDLDTRYLEEFLRRMRGDPSQARRGFDRIALNSFDRVRQTFSTSGKTVGTAPRHQRAVVRAVLSIVVARYLKDSLRVESAAA